jgi:aspartate aminotransferase-like enzyme
MENKKINFMPGPVNIHTDVKDVFYQTFESHRSAKFYNDMANFKSSLCQFVNAQNAAFMVGSGSLANEMVAQYLKKLPGKGLILINGEFGKRLKEQASYSLLTYDIYMKELGEAFDYNQIEKLVSNGEYTWLWFVHCETSSGVLNKLETLKAICKAHQIKLAIDCISSVANTSVNLENVYLASSTSGKGLASYPGVAIVFFNESVLELNDAGIPKYFNLKHHLENKNVPYTISTNLFYALRKAFEGVKENRHRENIAKISKYIYGELSQHGFTFLGNQNEMMSGIISIICPAELNSYDLGVELEQNNFYVNYGGAYLRTANYFQICIMGHQTLENSKLLIDFLKTKTEALKLKNAS